MKRTAAITLSGLAALLSACEADPAQPLVPNQPSLSQNATATTDHFSSPFTATAMCGSEIGRIRFSGIIEGVQHTTLDANGETHRTRQFRVKGLSGINLDYGTEYRVIGGAEMLTWNTQIGQVPGNPLKSIHAGTLVFAPADGGNKVVAHHAIRFVENANGEEVVDFHEWRCHTQA
jgi:hypothetical protein